jgi:hypothetical protein
VLRSIRVEVLVTIVSELLQYLPNKAIEFKKKYLMLVFTIEEICIEQCAVYYVGKTMEEINASLLSIQLQTTYKVQRSKFISIPTVHLYSVFSLHFISPRGLWTGSYQ